MKIGDKPIWSVDMNAALGVIAVVCGVKCHLLKYQGGKLEMLQSIDPPHSKTIRRVRIKPNNDGKYPTMALGSFDGTCSIFGSDSITQEWEMLAVIEGHESEIKGVDWSFDGKYLVTCGRDKSIWVWETDPLNEEFECICVLNEHEGDVKAVKWAPNSHSFISCSYDDSFKVWKQDTGGNEDQFDCVADFNVGSTVWDCSWVSETCVVVGLDDGRVLQYELATSQAGGGSLKPQEEWLLAKEWCVQGSVYGLAVTRGGEVIAVGSSGLVESSDGASSVACAVNNHLADVNCVASSSNDNYTVVGDDSGVLTLLSSSSSYV